MTAVTPALLLRGALVVGGAAVWTVAAWGPPGAEGGSAAETVAFVGGWSLSVLPVHARIEAGAEACPLPGADTRPVRAGRPRWWSGAVGEDSGRS
jgi:hypothetical protein